METVIIILAIIGLLKVISLFILCIIKLYHKVISKDFTDITKCYTIDIVNEFNLIPNIKFIYTSRLDCFEIIVSFLNIEYYSCYSIRTFKINKTSKK